jgi:hypothetical protein
VAAAAGGVDRIGPLAERAICAADDFSEHSLVLGIARYQKNPT